MKPFQKKDKCPSCNKEVNTHDTLKGSGVPSKGDVSVCLYCGSIMMFNEDLELYLPSAKELLELKKEPELWAEIWGIATAIKLK